MPERWTAAGLPRQDHVWNYYWHLFRFHKNEFDEMPCKLDSTEFARLFRTKPNPTVTLIPPFWEIRPFKITDPKYPARLILLSFLWDQTLRGWTLQNNPTKNPETLMEHRQNGQRSTLLRKGIWPQGCEKPDASNVRFESHLASHSPVAKSPYGAELTFVYLCDVPPVLWDSSLVVWVRRRFVGVNRYAPG